MLGWLMIHDSVLSKTKLSQGGMQIPTHCSMWSMSEETPLHISMDCQAIKRIWSQEFFRLTFTDWIYTNITQKQHSCHGVE